MTNYICITFGSANYNSTDGVPRWWNIQESFETQRAAERCGLDQMPIAGTFGYVVIKETEVSWYVVDELGAPPSTVSISCKGSGIYSVQPAAKLVMV